jgi:FdrA protein
VASALLEQAASAGKPVVACFLGTSPESPGGNVRVATTLEDAARAAVRAAGTKSPPATVAPPVPPATGCVLRGLYTGGTFASEASAALGGAAAAHAIVDLGADEFTVGRPHPMIDPSLRIAPLREALAAPDTAVVVLDVVGGYGASDNPVGPLLPVLAERDPAGPPVIAFVVATESDPLPRSLLERQLETAGTVVAESSTAALRLAAAIMTGVAA